MVPEGWKCVPLEEVAEVRTGVAKNKKKLVDPVELPYLRVANVQDGRLDLDEVKTIEVERRQIERYSLVEGDVLMTEGGDFDKLGRGDVWRGQIPQCLHQNHVFAVRVDLDALSPYFLSALSGSAYGKDYFLSCAKRSTNLASINSTQLKRFPVLLPPLEEQLEIVEHLMLWDKAIDIAERLVRNAKLHRDGVLQRFSVERLLDRSKFANFSRKKLGDVAEVLVSNVDKKISAEELPVKLCNYMDVYSNRYIDSSMTLSKGSVTPAELGKFSVQLDDVLITKDSEKPEDIAIPALVCEDLDNVVCGYHLALLRPIAKVILGSYLLFLLRSRAVRHEMSVRANGAIRFGLSAGSIEEVVLSFPDVETQAAVSRVLIGLDRVVSIREHEVKKLRKERVFLVQELVTGRRLVNLDKVA